MAKPTWQLIYILALFTMSLYGCSDGAQPEKVTHIRLENSAELRSGANNAVRYQFSSDSIKVIDTHTGRVWRATGPIGGPYQLVPLCYRNGKNFHLSVTPDIETDTQLGFTGECLNK